MARPAATYRAARRNTNAVHGAGARKRWLRRIATARQRLAARAEREIIKRQILGRKTL